MLTGVLFRSMVNRVRTELMDLAPYQENFNQFIQRPYPIAYGYSPSVQAQPADWGKHLKVTGYWFLDEPYTPSPEFAAWLEPAPAAEFRRRPFAWHGRSL